MNRTDTLFSQLLATECPDSTYRPKSHPIVLERALGSLLYDVEGKEYIDLCAGFGVLPFGHNADYLRKILVPSDNAFPPIMHGLGDVYPSVDKIALLKELFKVLPAHLAKAAVALTGAQAIELALKTAIIATGRRNFLAFEHSYHGLDLGVLPVTFRSDFKAPFHPYLKADTSQHLPFNCDIALVDKAMTEAKARGNSFAAVVVEPVQGRGGVVPARTGWLAALKDVCARHDVLLIFDEVFTGFGRIGSITVAHEVAADLVCFGKAMGGGFPISVCVGTEKVMSAWPACESEALHTGTFFGHPLSCRVAAATIALLRTTDTIPRSAENGEALRAYLREEIGDSPLVRDIRGEGMMTGVEFTRPGFGAVLMDALRSQGVIAIPSGPNGNVLSITPSLNSDMLLLNKAVRELKAAIFAHTQTTITV